MPALIVFCLAVVVAGLAGRSSSPAEAQASCRGAAALGNYLTLVAGRRISIKRVRCGQARSVPKRFAARCLTAYTSQGACRVKAGRRWRCTSRIVGSAQQGAPSVIRCTAGRSRVGFKVALSDSAIQVPPVEGVTSPGAPYFKSLGCIDSNTAGEAAAPPTPPNDGFIIYVTGATPVVVADAVTAEAVSHNVGKRLSDGLGAKPRNYPGLLPVFLRKGVSQGVTSLLCGGNASDGSVVEIEDSVDESAGVVAHELFHAFSRGVAFVRGYYPWFEDLAAEWSVWKAGLMKEPTSWEVFLQYPDNAADTLVPEGYRYGMWRFVQFLDDKGMIVVGDGSWPLIRGTVRATPQMTVGLDQQLASRGSSLGAELAAFWGEHLKAKPRRPPHIRPVDGNSEQVLIDPGQRNFRVGAEAIHTKLVDFKLASNVRRVEFEFEPPTNGFFFGLVAANESRRFETQGTVSFCVGAGGGDELEWPGNFPVTFTNGFLSGGLLSGTVRIYAQAQADQCTGLTNKACKVLNESGARSLLGPDLPKIGGYNGHGGAQGGRRYVSCVYKGSRGLASIQIQKWPSSKALRRWIERKGKAAGWQTVDLGDTAIVFEGAQGGHAVVQVAVGRQRLSVSVHGAAAARSRALILAREAIPEVR